MRTEGFLERSNKVIRTIDREMKKESSSSPEGFLWELMAVGAHGRVIIRAQPAPWQRGGRGRGTQARGQSNCQTNETR